MDYGYQTDSGKLGAEVAMDFGCAADFPPVPSTDSTPYPPPRDLTQRGHMTQPGPEHLLLQLQRLVQK